MAVVLVLEREAHAEHARLLLPVGHACAALRLLQREAPHHREAIRIQARGFEREIVALAFPRGWNQHCTRHTCEIHLEK